MLNSLLLFSYQLMNPIRFVLKAHDGQALAAYCHEPNGAVRAGMVIAPVLAAAQSFYAALAGFLARQGFWSWTVDFRGTGESLRGLPVFVMGHGLGGQTAPLLPFVDRISGLVMVARGSGSGAHNQPRVGTDVCRR